MELRAAYAFVLALFLALTLIPALVRLAGPLQLVDTGGGRKVHSGTKPRIGGVAIFLGFVTAAVVWVPLQEEVGSFFMALAVLFVFGLLDDRFNLDFRLKLLGQFLAAGFVVVAGGILIQRVPLIPGGTLPYLLAVPFTVLVIVAVTNAVNMSDGLDGLAGGIAFLSTGVLLALAYEHNDGVAQVVLAALLGATLGFLRFNTFPALLFMGDAGSQMLGFSLAVFAIIITQDPLSGISPTTPLLILAMPLLDMLTVMAARISRGDSPFRADRGHLHHRLLATGLTQREAVSTIYALHFALLVAAFLLRNSPAIYGLVVFIFAGLSLVGLLKALDRRRAELSVEGAARRRPVARLGAWIRRHQLLSLAPIALLRWAIPAFILLGALVAPTISIDIGVLSAVMLIILLLAFAVGKAPFFAVERLSAYVSATIIVYALWQATLVDTCSWCLSATYGIIAFATAFWIRFSQDEFQVNSLDVLIVIGALVAPNLRGLGLEDIGVLVLEIIVIFYALEVLIQARPRRWDLLRFSIVITLATLAARGLLAF